MNKLFLAAAAAATLTGTAASAQPARDYYQPVQYQNDDRPGYGTRRAERREGESRREYRDRQNRIADRRDERREDRRDDRVLTSNDQITRGRDGQYYCKRNDGTTGTVIGAIGGGVLGNVIAPGGSKALGTILGGVGGGLAGRAIGRDDGPKCR